MSGDASTDSCASSTVTRPRAAQAYQARPTASTADAASASHVACNLRGVRSRASRALRTSRAGAASAAVDARPRTLVRVRALRPRRLRTRSNAPQKPACRTRATRRAHTEPADLRTVRAPPHSIYGAPRRWDGGTEVWPGMRIGFGTGPVYASISRGRCSSAGTTRITSQPSSCRARRGRYRHPRARNRRRRAGVRTCSGFPKPRSTLPRRGDGATGIACRPRRRRAARRSRAPCSVPARAS